MLSISCSASFPWKFPAPQLYAWPVPVLALVGLFAQQCSAAAALCAAVLCVPCSERPQCSHWLAYVRSSALYIAQHPAQHCAVHCAVPYIACPALCALHCVPVSSGWLSGRNILCIRFLMSPALGALHRALYCTVPCTLSCTVPGTLCPVLCALHCASSTVPCAVCPATYPALCPALCALYYFPSTVCPALCALRCALHCAVPCTVPNTLRCALCAPH
jgi:hypothetical protein